MKFKKIFGVLLVFSTLASAIAGPKLFDPNLKHEQEEQDATRQQEETEHLREATEVEFQEDFQMRGTQAKAVDPTLVSRSTADLQNRRAGFFRTFTSAANCFIAPVVALSSIRYRFTRYAPETPETSSVSAIFERNLLPDNEESLFEKRQNLIIEKIEEYKKNYKDESAECAQEYGNLALEALQKSFNLAPIALDDTQPSNIRSDLNEAKVLAILQQKQASIEVLHLITWMLLRLY